MERVTINESAVARTEAARQKVLDEIARAVDRCLREAVATFGMPCVLERLRKEELHALDDTRMDQNQPARRPGLDGPA